MIVIYNSEEIIELRITFGSPVSVRTSRDHLSIINFSKYEFFRCKNESFKCEDSFFCYFMVFFCRTLQNNLHASLGKGM